MARAMGGLIKLAFVVGAATLGCGGGAASTADGAPGDASANADAGSGDDAGGLPATWQEPTVLATGFVFRPDLVVDATGTAYAVWEDIGPDPDVAMFSERPLGGAWTTPVAISGTGPDDAESPRIAVDPLGNLTVTFRLTFHAVATRRPAGGVWTTPSSVSDGVPVDRGVANTPRVLATPTGGAIVYWIRQEDDGDVATTNDPFQLELARLSPDGDWSMPEFVSSHPTITANDADLAIDADGNVVAVWLRLPVGAQDTVQARLLPATGPASAIIDLSDPTRDAAPPRVFLDDGQVTVIWEWDDEGAGVSVRERVGPLAGSWTSAADWSPITTVTPMASDLSSWNASQDLAGNTVVLFERDEEEGFYLESVQRARGGTWSSVQTVAGPLPGTTADESPQVLITPGGGAVALWGENDGAGDAIHTIRTSDRNADGTWTPATVHSSGELSETMWIVADPSGNLTAIWRMTPDGGGIEQIQATARGASPP